MTKMAIPGTFRDYVMTMNRVEKRLRKVTSALNAAQIPYAVIGGNAVAVWVAKADPAATRTTKDVDLLVNREDLDRITEALIREGFVREDLRRLVLFTDPEEPSRKSGIHLIWAGQKVRPHYLQPAPDLREAVYDPEGFWVLGLVALVIMKLTSFRDLDRVHIADLFGVGLINEAVRAQLPDPLRERLDIVVSTMEEEN